MKNLIRFLVITGLLIAGLWFFRTWFHGIFVFLYATPVIWYMLLITIILHFALFNRSPELKKIGSNAAITVSFFVFVFLLAGGLILAHIARGLTIAETVEYQTRESLPESTDSIRLMPYEVAKRYAKDSLQSSQFKLGTENIAIIDGKIQWVFPLTPDSFILTFNQKNQGIIAVDATTQAKNSKQIRQNLTIGEGMQIVDNLYWNLYRKNYFVTTDDPMYIPYNNDLYTIVGAIGYRFHFRWGIPFTVPYFKGVFIVDSAGNIEFVTPEKALEHPVLTGNRIFPENLTRTYVDAYQYHLGVLNKFFIHKDQIQIQDAAGANSSINRQPYLMNTKEGLKWFISTEPYGASHGIFKVFIVDARTGQIEIYQLPPEETLTGPVRAVDYIRRNNPSVDWSMFHSVEPLPFIRNQKLYWKLTIIPSDAAGIAFQSFIDAETNDVYQFNNQSAIINFLTGNTIDQELITDQKGTKQDLITEIKQKLKELESLLEQLTAEE
ncbi:MAG: hypothetical protein GX208_09160 [Firmicutes bacterium]|nr:hypothetical protein [Bacillota bacterium]